MNFEAVAQQFAQHYYNTFDTNRAALRALYQPQSMLTFEGQRFQGAEQIQSKLMSFSTNVRHNVVAIDSQPMPQGVLLTITGTLTIDQDNPLKFSQVFTLMSNGGSYFVLNDLFRLLYG
ncbi:nuclear transport factor 2 [Pelomyxa schiedti]|nr:nuclear transport factor 2 [Pelomyxa schiedti]